MNKGDIFEMSQQQLNRLHVIKMAIESRITVKEAAESLCLSGRRLVYGKRRCFRSAICQGNY